MGTAGGAEELESPDSRGRVVRVAEEIPEFESERTDQGLRRLRRFGVEDFKR